jgi:hypothetical protein
VADRMIVYGHPVVAKILHHGGNFSRHVLDISHVPWIDFQHLFAAPGNSRHAEYGSPEYHDTNAALPERFNVNQIHLQKPPDACVTAIYQTAQREQAQWEARKPPDRTDMQHETRQGMLRIRSGGGRCNTLDVIHHSLSGMLYKQLKHTCGRNNHGTMKNNFPEVASAEAMTTRQRLFLRYFTAILIDLVVLNLFAEHWHHVTIDSFTLSLFAAVLLQVLLKLTLVIEGRVADYFNAREGTAARAMRFVSAWVILFLSKFVILGAINFTFGDSIVFSGPVHGVLAFIVVVVVMLAAEEAIVRFYRRLV